MATQEFTLSKQQLDDLFLYQNGFLIRKTSLGNRKAGSIVGCKQKNGYFITQVFKRFYYVHRLIFMMHHGYMPKTVDHIDGNPSNNKIENLRSCSQSQNACNKTKQINNSSGYKNVYWASRHKRWVACVNYKGKKHIFGTFKNLDDAVLAAKTGRARIHGEFAKM